MALSAPVVSNVCEIVVTRQDVSELAFCILLPQSRMREFSPEDRWRNQAPHVIS
jgi:hypothetical protein